MLTSLVGRGFQFKYPGLSNCNLNISTTDLQILHNLPNLMGIDLSHNNLHGKFPNSLFENNSRLKILNMKNNSHTCRLQKIGSMDLSHNNLSGSIPLCFTNITFGRNALDEKMDFIYSKHLGMKTYYEYMFSDLITRPAGYGIEDVSVETDSEEVEFMMKSRSNSYKGEIINFMSGMDLTCNNLKGNILLDIGALTEIRALNLSHNKFTGVIPSSLSNMKQIESIEISHNRLSGDNPSNLTRLSTLVVFIVAYNNLPGRVPEMVAQFSTFGETSNEENPFLCGSPLKQMPHQCGLSHNTRHTCWTK